MSDKKPKYIEGVGWRYETEHRQTRRHPTHNYSGVGTYLVTLVVTDRLNVFGYVEGDLQARKGDAGYAHLVPTPLAVRVLDTEVQKIHQHYPMVDVWKIVLMPDHIHMIVRVGGQMPQGKNLGQVIRGFKTGCCRAWWEICGMPPSDEADGTGKKTEFPILTLVDRYSTGGNPISPQPSPVSSASSEERTRPLLFEPGYNDHILMRDGQLNNWIGYLEENPFRLLVRQRCPDIMQRALCLTINNKRYSAFGNFSLLKVPEKQQVMCHRKATLSMLTSEERQQYGYADIVDIGQKTTIAYEDTAAFKQQMEQVLETAKEGVVVVTPGISKGELSIKHECIEQRLPLILLQKEHITSLWKPEKERFYACTTGKLLILAPWQEDLQGSSDYDRFHNLNDLAAEICDLDTTNANFGCKIIEPAT